MRARFSSLRSRLVLLAGSLLIPLCALILMLGSEYYRFTTESVYKNVEALSRLLATAQSEKIEDTRQFMATLADMPEIRARQGDYCGLLSSMKARNALQYADLGMTDAVGRSLCGDAATPLHHGIGGKEWLYTAIEQSHFAVDAYGIDAVSGKAIAILVHPILDSNGRVQGSIFAALDLAWIARLNALAVLPERSIVLMFDQEGLVLRRDPDADLWVGKRYQDAPFLKRIMAGGSSGVLDMPALDGIRRLVAFKRLPSQNGNVYLVVGVPHDVAFAGVYKQFRTVGLIAGLTIFVTLALTWMVGEKLIAERVGRLAAAARQFVEGKNAVQSGVAHANDEIGDLASAFDAMTEAIKLREEKLRQYYHALDHHAIVSVADLTGNITFANDKFCEISGYSRDELLGNNHRMLNSGFHSPDFFEEMWKTISSGRAWQGVICNRCKSGNHYWVVSTIVPQLDESGSPVYYLSIRTDVTVTLKIQEALERSEEKFRLLAENSRDIVALHELDGRFVYASPSVKAVLGYDHAQMIGDQPWQLVHPKDLALVRQEWHQAVVNGQRSDDLAFRVRCNSGDYIWIEALFIPVAAADGEIFRIQVTMRNITQRKEAEDRLRLHDKAIQASPSGIALFSNEKHYPVTYVNQAFESITGFAKVTAGDQQAFRLRDMADAESIDRFRGMLHGSSNDQALLRITCRDGRLRWLDCMIAPVRNEEGEVTHFVAAFLDMTERITIIEELIHARDASELANQAKSEFLSRMTHELRTPLNFILGFAQLIEAQAENLTAYQRDGIQRILSSGWHLRELIDEVLDLARIESGTLEVQSEHVSLSQLVDECCGIVELSAAGQGISIFSAQPSEAVGQVRADRMRLKQVLLNLLSNAVKFNRPGGTVTIKQQLTASGNVRIIVTDTGSGIDASRFGELFRPFSRLGADRAEIPGTGIGLAISQRFMQLMDGEIGVSSEVGKGSSFWIELPWAGNCGTEANAGGEAKKPRRSGSKEKN